MTPDFLPGTLAREISPGIFFRPIRSWSCGTYAGEGLEVVNGDGSGCLRAYSHLGMDTCFAPWAATHRFYWHIAAPTVLISAFQSYPGKMGHFTLDGKEVYFWEIYNGNLLDDIERFAEEAEMEKRVIEILNGALP